MRTAIVRAGAAFALIMASQPVLAEEIGQIKNVTQGGVEVQRGDKSLRGVSGFRVMEGDVVVTGARQRVGITFLDDTRMAVAPGSRVVISRYRYDRARETGSSLMQVDRGAVGVDSGKLSGSGRMRFKTPTSTLGVRGTSFVIEVDAE
ncbi:FecR family protein [Erythrobacter sp.]|uniref:FecR family protein n=1 Tax=Erythrobacter sp. TaxID=1042 RepID=UPI002E99AF7B|nr:FecR domain-containing protein [Erythrobacter sp.]